MLYILLWSISYYYFIINNYTITINYYNLSLSHLNKNILVFFGFIISITLVSLFISPVLECAPPEGDFTQGSSNQPSNTSDKGGHNFSISNVGNVHVDNKTIINNNFPISKKSLLDYILNYDNSDNSNNSNNSNNQLEDNSRSNDNQNNKDSGNTSKSNKTKDSVSKSTKGKGKASSAKQTKIIDSDNSKVTKIID